MIHHFIFAQTPQTAAALKKAWLPVLRQAEAGWKQSDDESVPTFIWSGRKVSADAGLNLYMELEQALEVELQRRASSVRRGEFIALVDSVQPAQLNAIEESCTWEHLLALLILTFPEVTWAFGAPSDSVPGFDAPTHTLDGLLSRASREPLLDPSGLRNWVRNQTNSALTDATFGIAIASRSERACAVDEECNYALFNGYTAYRYGFLADAIYTWRLMQERFASTGVEGARHGYHLLLEDMSVHFPDRPAAVHISTLEARGSELGLLTGDSSVENSDWRILITSGEDGSSRTTLSDNRRYLEAYKPGRHEIVYKPVGGMLDLWSEAHQMTRVKEGQRAGNAPSFCWPPEATALTESSEHGAPGKLMLVAETLIGRAERLRETAQSLHDYIFGAVLASDAAELLCGRTPMLALSAVALKHEFEARAECAFIGTGHAFEVEGRIRELTQEVKAISRSFTPDAREASENNALGHIVNRLALVFREGGKFDEEEACMTALRRVHRRLNYLKVRGDPLRLVPWALLAYAESVMASMDRFVLAILGWLVFFVGAWALVECSLKSGVVGVGSAFFGGNFAANDQPWMLAVISGLAVVLGYFHLGIFVSYLYSRVSRK